ncbi:MAG: hypothetical protein LBD12_01490 [Clostridiales Family XIII bacterium]|jgi:hypothetical protein|nr:hypothetical protein [Clostridiales Family XIII bacterium]
MSARFPIALSLDELLAVLAALSKDTAPEVRPLYLRLAADYESLHRALAQDEPQNRPTAPPARAWVDPIPTQKPAKSGVLGQIGLSGAHPRDTERGTP